MIIGRVEGEETPTDGITAVVGHDMKIGSIASIVYLLFRRESRLLSHDLSSFGLVALPHYLVVNITLSVLIHH